MSVAMAAIDLVVGYGSRRRPRPVLRHVDLEVRAGEFVCLLGPNGIGKSTLLRTLARTQPALGGRVEIAGKDVRTLSAGALARVLAVVLTERPAVEGLSARRVVEIGRYAHASWFGGQSDRDRAVVDWALDAAGAAHLADRDLQRLSDGERQRVMIARALAQQPVLVILDEPTAFLDVSARVEMMALLRRLARDQDLSVVVSTHDLDLALRLADRIWLVPPDGLVISGAPEDLMAAGHIARTFGGRRLAFDVVTRAMQWHDDPRGHASLRGEGLARRLARAVLEREGIDLDDARAGVHVVVDDDGWRATRLSERGQGRDFASLAEFIRKGV